MIDSESREDLPRTLGRGEGITSLSGHAPRFLRVLYEGGRPYPREDFHWSICLSGVSGNETFGLIAPTSRKESPGDRRGTHPDKRHPRFDPLNTELEAH